MGAVAVRSELKAGRQVDQLEACFRREGARLVHFVCDISHSDKKHLVPSEHVEQ